MPDLIKMVIEESEQRKLFNGDKVIPYYMASLGLHVFNLSNLTYKKFYSMGQIRNERLHVINVSPPGYSKTLWIDFFVKDSASILKGVKIKSEFYDSVTNRGLTGQVKKNDQGQEVRTQGAFQEFAEGILAFEEFNTAAQEFKKSFNRGLDSQLLTFLDSGRVNVNVGSGKINYVTSFTLWAATQPTRLDLGDGGLSRRLLMLLTCPTEEYIQKIKAAEREGINVKYDSDNLRVIKNALNDRMSEIQNTLQTVIFDPSVYKYFDELKLDNNEEKIYRKLLFGYWLMKSHEIKESIVLSINDEVKMLIERIYQDSRKIRSDPVTHVIWNYIKSSKTVDRKLFDNRMMSFELNKQADGSLKYLKKLNLIEYGSSTVSIKNEKDELGLFSQRRKDYSS